MPVNSKLSRSAMPFVLAVIITCVTTAAAITRAMADTGSPAERFAALVADFDAHERAHDPITAGRRGDLEALARWPDGSPEAVAGRLEAEAGFQARLQAIDAAALDAADQVSHEVMAYLLESRLSLGRFGHQRLAFTNDSGFFSLPLSVAAGTQPRSLAEAEAWLSRLEGIPALFAGHRAWLAQGADTGFVQPRAVVEEVLTQLDAIATTDPETSELVAPLRRLPSAIDASQREQLADTADRLLLERVLPAYRELATWLREVYLASPRESLGISEVPDGRDYYRAVVRHHTTLPLTPEDIHQRGLEEVARIRSEMDEVIERTGFEGTFPQFLEYLRTDPKFYAETAEELLMHAARIAKLADDAMPAFFGHLPRLPYGIRPVPEAMAPNYTTGRYWAGSLEAGIAGGYMVNTYALDQRPLYELPALTVHEAVPGHHHQIAIAQELENVPEFRRRAGITAYVEGWALYTEYLAQEMGVYRTAYEDFGRLTYEMWRACRLVVDTGLHYFGWTREQAEACLLENSALAPHNVRTEVSRYISWPGQALAYKLGELLIRELRAEAETTLGEAFDLRAFHDHILAEGAMPLAALERRMRRWIEAQLAGARL